jgi:hypothetical protein
MCPPDVQQIKNIAGDSSKVSTAVGIGVDCAVGFVYRDNLIFIQLIPVVPVRLLPNDSQEV